MDVTARAPILTENANYTQDYHALKTIGPFVPSFLTDSK